MKPTTICVLLVLIIQLIVHTNAQGSAAVSVGVYLSQYKEKKRLQLIKKQVKKVQRKLNKSSRASNGKLTELLLCQQLGRCPGF